MDKKRFITSALPYVNNQPHLGNIIGCVLSSDVYSRYCKKRGIEAVHICGTDEYGTAIEMSAIANKKTPEQICEENRAIHKRVYDWFDIKFDYFGQTSSNEEHKQLVQDLFLEMYKNGYFSEESLEMLYCNKCDLYLSDRYVVGICKFCNAEGARGDQCDACGNVYKSVDLISPKCTMCDNTEMKTKANNHLFFRLDLFKDQLKNFYEKNSAEWTQNAQNIFKQWINMDLYPRCMTRDLKYDWGVPVPLDSFKTKVFYVWFDAPIGYLTFLKQLTGDNFQKWMEESELIQFMGKDNVSFHTVIFPSMIMATKRKIPLVNKLSATEYLQFEDQKFSKSRNHGIFGLDLINNELGESCIWRYYLIKIRPELRDANFSFSDFKDSIVGDLINNIGNFCNRTLKYIKNKCELKVKIESLDERDEKMILRVNELYSKYLSLFESIKIKDAQQTVLEISRAGNEYLQDIIQNDKDRRHHGFSMAFSIVVLLGNLLEPFIPKTSKKILKMCNMEEKKFAEKMEIVNDHFISSDITPLFTHFTDEQNERFSKFMKKDELNIKDLSI